MAAFSVEARQDGPHEVLLLSGEFDIAGADQVMRLAEATLNNGGTGTELVLDLSAVTFIDSTGIGTLVAVRNLAVERQVVTRLRRPSPAVASLLALTAVDRLFEGTSLGTDPAPRG
jgi:anti-sigma B factor antagonist